MQLEIDLDDVPVPAHRMGLKELRAKFPHLFTGPASPVFGEDGGKVPPPAAPFALAATRTRRLVAFGIDLALFTGLWGLLMRAGRMHLQANPQLVEGLGRDTPGIAAFAASVLLYLLYFVGFEVLTKASPGKLLTGIRVVGPFLRGPGLLRALARNLLRITDGAMICTVVMASAVLPRDDPRRFGDIMAGVYVVRS